MAMKLDRVIPFGRSLDEYIKMFMLSDEDLKRKILGVGDGPASFNAELTALGGQVTSVDPLYSNTSNEIFRRFQSVVDNVIEQIKATPNDWTWSYHKSPEELRKNRVRVSELFAKDFCDSQRSTRYVTGELPKLSFQDGEFDLALCSHFLFLYSAHFDFEFHISSITEMLRLADEVRIFPLLTLMLKQSPYLDQVINHFERRGIIVDVEVVDYELQRGGNQMLRLRRSNSA